MKETIRTLLSRSGEAADLAYEDYGNDGQQEKADRRWNTDLELTIAQKPALQGKEQAFKEFAKKPTHRGTPLETLVSAFLFESSSNPSPTPAPTSPPGLLPSNGGPRGPEKPTVLS
jgi:hypothetical protein